MLLLIGDTLAEAGPSETFMATFDMKQSRDWLRQPWAFDVASKATSRIVEALRPPGDVKRPRPPKGPPGPVDYATLDHGAAWANAKLEEAASRRARVGHRAERAAVIHRLLEGPIADQLAPFDHLSERKESGK